MTKIIDVSALTPNELVSWFLISSYAYYKLGKPVIPDNTFDELVERLKQVYDEADHPHKSLITKDHLLAATGFDIRYPTIVQQCAVEILRE